jgi:O-antigen/teichoic acid export membrane protein
MPATSEPIPIARLGRHTATYTLGILLNRAAAFIMLPIYSRYLTPADYGVIQLVEMTLDFIAILAGAKLAVGVFRYSHEAKTEEERNSVASTSLLLICGAYAVVSAMAIIFAGPLSHLVFQDQSRAQLIRVSAIGLAAQSMSIVPLAYARLRGRSLLFVGANLSLLTLQITMNIVLLVRFHLGALAVFISNAIAAIIVGSALASNLVRQTRLHFSPVLARRLIRYGLPLVATQVATFVATFGDRYFLNGAADMTTVGLYALAYQFGFLLAMVGSMPVDLVWEPIRFSLAERPDRDHVLSRAFVYLNLLLITTALGITLFVGDVLRMMTVPAFYPAADLVPVVLIAYVFQSWTIMQDVGIHLRERTEYITIANWVAAGVAFLGYVALIPRWLGLGAAIATVLSFGVRYVIILRLSLRLLPVRYTWSPVRRIIGFAVASVLLSFTVLHDTGVTAFAVRVLCFVGYLAALWFGGVLTATERKAAKTFVAQLRRRLRRPEQQPLRPLAEGETL